jgi:predicted transcriptional regulator
MTTMTLEVDEQIDAANPFIDFVQSLGFVSVISLKQEKKSGIEKALADVRAGRVYTAKNAEDLMQKTIN